MDCKIKLKVESLKWIVIALIALVLLPSCKTNNWADWKTQNEIWLANNKLQPGVETSPSGLQYKIIKDPLKDTGEATPNPTGTIVCDYSLKLVNGNIIESANNATLNLANVIAGFAEGCHKVHVHGDIELYIPAYLGYDKNKYDTNDYGSAEGSGTEGTQSYIPPYSTLIYTVHICSIIAN